MSAAKRKYKPYPKYKDSGVEWLGRVPEHWGVKAFKRFAKICNGQDYKTVEDPDGEYPVMGSGGQFARAKEYLYNGETVLLGRKGTVDKPLYFKGPFWAVDTMFYTKIYRGVDGRFLYNSALTIPFGRYITSTALPSMTQETLGSHLITDPTLSEQTAIADFIERECGRMDKLVEKKQEFIALLKEKRQALITHAVTKGLDPKAAMKDSGVEWLGKVPKHWDILPFKYCLSTMFNGTTATQIEQSDDTVFVTRIETISGGVFCYERVGHILRNDAPDKARMLKGDIAFSNINSLAMIGNAALFDGSIELYAGMNLLVLRPQENILPEWLYSLICSKHFRQEVESRSKPAINQASISQSSLGAIPCPVPPSNEKKLIADHIDRETTRIDRLIAKTIESIDLLKERKTALITAAVTGQIDTRSS